MKAVIQKVACASVYFNDTLVAAIGPGLCVLVAFSLDDTPQDVDYMARKIINLRIYEGKPTQSVKGMNYEILCQSQISLYNKMKGNKVSFRKAMSSKHSADMFKQFILRMGQLYTPRKVKEGMFGGKKEMNVINDGPFTIILESPVKQNKTNIVS